MTVRQRVCLLILAVLIVPFPVLANDADGTVEVPGAVARLKQRLVTLENRVVGRPEPPLPYTVEAVYPKLILDNPMFVMLQPGSSRLLFIDQGGKRLCRTDSDPATGRFDVLFTCDGIQYSLCTHPNFLKNGLIYLGGDRKSKTPSGKECTVLELRLDPSKGFAMVEGSERMILSWDSNGHNGAALGFGHDGMLYITSGDGTSDSDTNVTGQKMDLLLAKVLRIDVDHPDRGKTYSVPADNPFVGRRGIRSETWAFGLRNPWRLSVDPLTGDIWVGNNGQDLWEQIYRVQKGDNYGWSVYEGSHPFYLQRKLGPAPHVKPTFEHPHSEARSLTGGVVYTARLFADLYGAYLYGDHSTGKIWAGRMNGDRVAWHKEIADTSLQIVGFGHDAAGNMLVVDYRKGATFHALRRRKSDPKPRPRFPRLLSQTGLLESVKGHRTHPALIPYSVNAPLWSDGSHKRRWIAMPVTIDPQAQRTVGTINTSKTTRGWSFPDGTVLVKSFGLKLAVGHSGEGPAALVAAERWVETRLLHRDQGEWVGYSYSWNDAQTEAELVVRSGQDRVFEVVRDGGGVRKLAWHYPSRAECMVCHSRAAEYVLGLTTVQMNRDHVHGGVPVNQLSVLAELGLAPIQSVEELRARRRQALEDGTADNDRASRSATDDKPELAQGHMFSGRLLTRPFLVDPYSDGSSLELRVRSYLHANCAQCHVSAGGGNSQIELNFSTPIAKAKLLGVKPVHDTFGLADARLVVPGHPERSVLLKRLKMRGRGQMPQLATTLPDARAVSLLREWIQGLGAVEAESSK
jgi:glucose/arabinose dehydrogenase